MARLTTADAARQLGLSRTTLSQRINQGRVSATPEGLSDATALVRAAPAVDTRQERARTSLDTAARDMHRSPEAHRERPPEAGHAHPWTRGHARQGTSTDPLVDVLRDQLQRAQERERIYEGHERASHDHMARLTARLHAAQRQHQQLRDMPRRVPVPPLPGPRASGADVTPRGERRRRLGALLQEHLEGLSPAQTRRRLGLDKDLGSTMKAMGRSGESRQGGRWCNRGLRPRMSI
jgi:hypothetical protein